MTASTLHAAAPVWPSAGEAARVEAELRRRPGLVRPADCASLRDGLARVAAGEAYLVQGGDCAELFAEVSARTTARKCAQLHELAGLLGRPVVRVGRLAGQFAKPRSHPTEPGADGTPLPVYRGDAVNGLAPADRVPDPRRMLTAYELSAQVLSQLAGHLAGRGVYTSHEALLPGYEDGLTRTDPATGTRYGSSGHLLWIGDRTRHPDGRHVELLAGLSNPVAVKLGPTATSADVAALVDRLDPHRVPGRLVLVPRLGADRVRELLPALVAAVRDAGARPAWVCDPMHGNTVRTPGGGKTRAVADVVREVAGFVAVLRAAGVHPGGLHLEVTPDDVTECVDVPGEVAPAHRYRSACDPRLNHGQARRVVAAFAAELAGARSARAGHAPSGPPCARPLDSVAALPCSGAGHGLGGRRMKNLGVDELRPADVAAVARRPGGRPVALNADTRRRMARSVALRDELVASGQPVYGVTTGFGDRNVSQVSPRHAETLQRNLIRYHLVGSGPPAPAEVVRATMLVRANCLARGRSGIRAEVLDLLLDCLAADILPVVPQRGSVGASGDLVPLCYVADLLTGDGEVCYAGRRTTAAAALAVHGLHRVELQPKEALALINGTSFMSGFAVLAAADAAELALVADVCTALAVEVLHGNRGPFDPAVHAHKPHPGQVRSAATVRALLAGSGLARDPEDVRRANADLGDREHRLLDHPIQDRYSVRCAPHVVGVLRDTLDWVDRWLDVEINSTNDNPLFDPDTWTVHNGGNFYGGHVGQAMDSLKVAVASVGDLLDRQLSLVVDHRYSNGLPPGLAPAHDGLHHGFKGAQIACSALVAEALKTGTPATAFSRSTEAHNQDKVSMGTIAARDAWTVVELVRDAAALHLAALCQAADLRGADALGHGTRAAYDLVRKHVGVLHEDRRLDGELAALSAALRAGALGEAVGPYIEKGDTDA